MNRKRPTRTITADSLVQDVVEGYPQTVAVFVHYGCQCVGCYIAPFHTISDSAREYALALPVLLEALNQAVAAPRQEHCMT